jgi:Dienelactone hydrolase family
MVAYINLLHGSSIILHCFARCVTLTSGLLRLQQQQQQQQQQYGARYTTVTTVQRHRRQQVQEQQWKLKTTQSKVLNPSIRGGNIRFIATSTPMVRDNHNVAEELRMFPEQWTPLTSSIFSKYTESRDASSCSDPIIPQMAASQQSAQTLMDAWIEQDCNHTWTTEYKMITYSDNYTTRSQSIPLYGYCIRNAQFHTTTTTNNTFDDIPIIKPTYILFFPTAVGVHDLFLFYKATQLVNHKSLQHCTVMIVDLISDATGWLWDKATHQEQYDHIRDELLRHSSCDDDDDNGTNQVDCHRPILQNRIKAAFDYIRTANHINVNNTCIIAALGWCFGGHCIAELARMRTTAIFDHDVRAMITFHGVFAGLQLPSSICEDDLVTDTPQLPRRKKSEILICHGVQDPFVPSDDIEIAL